MFRSMKARQAGCSGTIWLVTKRARAPKADPAGMGGSTARPRPRRWSHSRLSGGDDSCTATPTFTTAPPVRPSRRTLMAPRRTLLAPWVDFRQSETLTAAQKTELRSGNLRPLKNDCPAAATIDGHWNFSPSPPGGSSTPSRTIRPPWSPSFSCVRSRGETPEVARRRDLSRCDALRRPASEGVTDDPRQTLAGSRLTSGVAFGRRLGDRKASVVMTTRFLRDAATDDDRRRRLCSDALLGQFGRDAFRHGRRVHELSFPTSSGCSARLCGISRRR